MAKYFADDFIQNMKTVYYANMQNIHDLLPQITDSGWEDSPDILGKIEQYKKESLKKLNEYYTQLQNFASAKFALENQIDQALKKYGSDVPFIKLFDFIKEKIYKCYEDIETVLSRKNKEEYIEDFTNIKSITWNKVMLDREIDFFREGKIEEKEKEIRKIVSERKRDKVKNFFKSIKGKLT
ncbi:hypothetical protein [Holospora elegans]|uniref:hypothetical protein n=1 Tax=Holospora elegans TaxID=431043 RepID=UPI0013922C1D|nr:hypothetical protein [Holospora elegans]